MKNSQNSVVKQKYFAEYKFPRSTKDKAIIEASTSGWGFKSKYNPEWAELISEAELDQKILQVSLSTHLSDQQDLLPRV